MLRPPSVRKHKRLAVNAKMWYSGKAVSTHSSSFFMNVPPMASICCTLCSKLLCVSMAPLLTPVVPPVYCSTARVSRLMRCHSVAAGVFAKVSRPKAKAVLSRVCGTVTGGKARLHTF